MAAAMLARAWSREVDRELTAIVRRIVEGDERAWLELLERIGPRIEVWAARSRALRRVGLAAEDDVRAVLVSVLARMRSRDFHNLRQFLASLEGTPADQAEELAEVEVVEAATGVASLALSDDVTEDQEPRGAERDAASGTPFRGWLLTLVRFAAKDHVKQRFGWSSAPGTGTGDGAHGNKRKLHSEAEPLRTGHGGAARPPVTDLLTLRRLVIEVHEFMREFPPPMRRAVQMWLEDASFDEIGEHLELGGERGPASEARALVRAGQARLRHRFRGEWARFVRRAPAGAT